MKKLNLQVETNLLLAKQIIKRNNCSSDLINWALLLIEDGYCSDNLYILAGLNSQEIWDIDAYFRKVLDDFNIDSNIQKKELMDFYLIHYIKKAIDNPKILDNTIRLLSEVIYDTSYSPNKHLDFFFLYDELEELTGISREQYAINKFKAFINELENKQ